MNSYQQTFLEGVGFGLAIGLLLGWMAYVSANTSWEQQALKVGAAEYVIANPQTGAVKFQWKGGAK